ncbi:hypothetical protein RND71_010140 [Anisodus tanguticus]|uniref:Bifunctional inhibitor/plant lipid transfer protein/seed storage helical domain-containing protein n=1 Tax=Anisodus tanguticus TaxID=243964 RepID=A0AAE1SIN8_9SOLA|nr:hypothetical protein RND71_010140 [Anisodus tanguticus]
MATFVKITTTIATTFLILSLFPILIPSTKAQDSPPAPSPGVDCFTVLVNMSDCLTFVERGSNLSKPDKGCCPEIAGLLDSNPICLCHMLGRAHSGAKIGLNIDVDKALKLPSACSLQFPSASTCSDLGVPVGAPLASEEGPAPSPGGFATSPTSDKKDNAASIIVFSKMQFYVSCVAYDDWRTSTSASEMTPLLWPRQDEMTKRFNLNDTSNPARAVADLNAQRMAHVSLPRDDGHADNTVILPCLKSMTWVMENKTSAPANRVAVINLKLQDYSRTPSRESEVKFQLSRVTLEPMLKSMAYISEQLSAPANRVAVINLKLQDTETTSGESEVKFQVSRDTLGAMLRSMAYIREQLSNTVESQLEIPAKKQRK